jgi:hypothetical protein
MRRRVIRDNRAAARQIRADQEAIRDELKKLADEKGPDAIASRSRTSSARREGEEQELRAAGRGAARRQARRHQDHLCRDLKAWRERRATAPTSHIDAARQKLDDDKARPPKTSSRSATNHRLKDKWRADQYRRPRRDHQQAEESTRDSRPLFDKLDDDADRAEDKLDADRASRRRRGEEASGSISKAWRDAHQA